jgi:hypothetical protein
LIAICGAQGIGSHFARTTTNKQSIAGSPNAQGGAFGAGLQKELLLSSGNEQRVLRAGGQGELRRMKDTEYTDTDGS